MCSWVLLAVPLIYLLRDCCGSGVERGLLGTCGQKPCTASLLSSDTEIQVDGSIATAQIRQTFRGAGDGGTQGMSDVSFVFPINEGAVVTQFAVDVDGIILQGVVRERRQAQQMYDSEVLAGRMTALAQHGASRRQNAKDAMDVYRISLGNIPAQGLAHVNLSFVQELSVEDGGSEGGSTAFFRLLVPAVVGAPSRYCPSGLQGGAEADDALQASGQQVPSVVRIRAMLQGPLLNVTSPSHGDLVFVQPWPQNASKGRGHGVLADLHMLGHNVSSKALHSDFVLRIKLEEEALEDNSSLLAPRAALEKHPIFDTWAAMVEFVPRFSLEIESNVEISFLVDRSGSMQDGIKIPACRRALQHFVRSSPADALVNIVGFGSTYKPLFDHPQRLRHDSFRDALAYAEDLEESFGGTEILSPLQWLLNKKLAEGRERRIIVLTDGEVWNQDQVIRTVREACGSNSNCQLFALGIGNGVSTALIEGMARAGRGFARFVAQGEEEVLEDVVVQLMAAALQPSFTDVSIEWPKTPEPLFRRKDVPLLSRLRSKPAAPRSQAQAPENAAGSLFETGPVMRPAQVLEARSVASASEADERKRKEDLARFAAQGGVVEGPLQVPQPLPSVLLGQRWAAYALLGRMGSSEMPTAFVVKARRGGSPLEIRVPIIARTVGRTLHVLAAKHLAQTLRHKQSDAASSLEMLPGAEDRDWQVSAVGVAYSIATSQTSWLALDGRTGDFSDAQMKTNRMSTDSMFATQSGTVGSSLSVRSFCRLGSAFSVGGLATLGSSISLLACARLGSSVSVLDFAMVGSSISLRSFARLPSSMSVLDLPQPRSSISVQAVTPSSYPADMTLLGFLSVGFHLQGIYVPILPVWHSMGDSAASVNCLALSTSWSKIAAATSSTAMNVSLIPPTVKLHGSKHLAGNVSVLSASLENISLSKDCEVYVGSTSSPLAKIQPGSFSFDPKGSVPFESMQVQQFELDADLTKWPCPAMPLEAYAELLSAQKSDGSFAWPEAALSRLGRRTHRGNSISAWSPVEGSAGPDDVLPTCVALAMLRRCFSRKRRTWHLVEQKSIAWLRGSMAVGLDGRAVDADQLVALSNLVVLQGLVAAAASTDA